MNKFSFKDYIPYVAAILIFIIITMIYFNPLLQGKKLRQGDIDRHKGMSKEIVDFREKTGEEALWTNSMFGGMPAYQISVKYKSNLFRYIDDVFLLGLPRPAGYVFLYFLGFFILLLSLRINPWLGMVGAIAFTFSSYFFIILEAGHNSKAHAIGYMAPVLAGIILTYRGKYILGGIVTALFLALEIQAGHPQMTYYLLLIVVIYGIFELINTIREKQLPHFLKATGILVIAALLAVLTHTTSLWATYEYGKHTIRGKSELSDNKEDKTSGLDRSYVTAWSYGIDETFTLLIPNTKGGATNTISSNPKALEKVDRPYRQTVGGQNHYWGDQTFTSGPVYVGAIIMFFFVLGMFIVKGRMRWILFTATVVSIALSWGKHFMPLTDFFLDYIPGYNKFRAVSMTLVIAELCIPILAILAIDKIIREPGIIKEKRKEFYIAFGLTGGLSLLFYLAPTLFFDFISQAEAAQFDQVIQSGANAAQFAAFTDNLEAARLSIFKADAIRSFLYILIAAIFVWLYSLNKMGRNILIGGIAVLFLLDMATICYRYVNSDTYVRDSRSKQPYQVTISDQEIKKDTDPNYRVLNLTLDPFKDASTSYFHKSIGGYHGAKLRRYQELYEKAILPEMQKLISAFNEDMPMNAVDNAMRNLPVLNMLNTKYFIINPAQPPLMNRYAYGNAWFVKDVKIVENADEEILAVQDFEPLETVIIDKRFVDDAKAFENGFEKSGNINLINYKPNKLTYKSNSATDQFAVFSEIYYPKGWNAYIDGEPAAHFRVDYVLRGMIIPAGEHTIEFVFEPKVYTVGESVSLISSIILILLIVGGAWLEIRKKPATEEKEKK